MNIFADFEARVAALLNERVAAGALAAGLDLGRFVVEPPREAAHGDLSTNAAMVYAKEAKAAGSNPRALAEALAEGLRKGDDVRRRRGRRPGLPQHSPAARGLRRVLRDGLSKARPTAAANATGGAVNVEYVSANPTGPMHVGHARGAVFGDALAKLLAFSGRKVTREFYINDAGAQVDVLARSAYLRYREALGETIGPIPGGALSRRLSQRRRRGARGGIRRAACATRRRRNGCRSFARARSRQ